MNVMWIFNEPLSVQTATDMWFFIIYHSMIRNRLQVNRQLDPIQSQTDSSPTPSYGNIYGRYTVQYILLDKTDSDKVYDDVICIFKKSLWIAICLIATFKIPRILLLLYRADIVSWGVWWIPPVLNDSSFIGKRDYFSELQDSPRFSLISQKSSKSIKNVFQNNVYSLWLSALAFS